MRIQAEAAKVAEKARTLYSASRKATRNGAKEANSFIHRKPFLSILLGITAGYVAAHLFHPRNSR